MARNQKFEKNLSRSKKSKVAAGASLLGTFLFFLLSAWFKSEADAAQWSDPDYLEQYRKKEEANRVVREKELEAQKEKYILEQRQLADRAEERQQRYSLEQEKLAMEKENKRLDAERQAKAEAMAQISEFESGIDDLDDYARVDAAYSILDILKECDATDERVKYRALSCISKFVTDKMSADTKKRLEGIMAEIKGM